MKAPGAAPEDGEARATPAGSHAPASAAKYLKVREKVVELVDELHELSRASLERALPEILRRCGVPEWTEGVA